MPRPYARANIDVLVPSEYGRLLGDWRVSFIGRWQEGSKFTWTGGGSVPGVLNNVEFKDSWGLDLRFTKSLDLPSGRRMQFFVDIFNVFNRKQLSFNGFFDGVDQNAYLLSLHLPESSDYPNIPGNDKIGEYRGDDVEYQPMLGIQSRTSETTPRSQVIYYEFETKSHIVYSDGEWRNADPDRVQRILDDKAYIDMPNQSFLTFLDPRDVYFGVRINF